MTEKIKTPREKPIARLNYEIKVDEMEFGQEFRVSAEIIHELGKFSSSMATFKARAVLLPETDARAAAKTLVEFVESVVGESVEKRLNEITEMIEKRGYDSR